MTETEYFDSENKLSDEETDNVAEFLFAGLGQYGDPLDLIKKAVRHSMSDEASAGGFTAVVYEEGRIVGAAVINSTGMQDYIPENILVYLAVHRNFRGMGLGRRLLSDVLEHSDGDVALHVEPDNPAVSLYRSMGFENKYLEMRFIKNGQ